MRLVHPSFSRRAMTQAVLAAFSAVLLGIGVCSCGREEKRLTGNDARGHWMRRADEAAQQGNWDAAAELYGRALRHRPDMAAAHRRLAPILAEHKDDIVGALYHYERYLALAPNAPDREAVQEAAESCQQYIAVGTGGDTSGLKWRLDSQAETIQRLNVELARVNESLRITQARLESAHAATEAAERKATTGVHGPKLPVSSRSKPDAAPARPAKPAVPVDAAPSHPATEPGTYVVRSGDTLSKLASRFGTTTETLFAMNRHQMSSPNNLRVGMKLIVPAATRKTP